MAEQFTRPKGLAESLGTALGTGLGSGLERLTEMKLGQALEQQAAGRRKVGLEALGLFTPEQAQAISQDKQLSDTVTKQKIKEPFETKKVAQKDAKSYFKQIEADAVNPRKILGLYRALKEASEMPGFDTGFIANNIPYEQLSDANKLFETTVNELVGLKSQLSKGQQTSGKILLEKTSKPGVRNSPEVIAQLINRSLNDPETLRPIARDEARREMVNSKQGVTSDYYEQLSQRTDQILNELIKGTYEPGGEAQQQEQQYKEEYLDPKYIFEHPEEFDDGTELPYKNKIWVLKNGEWEDVNG